MKNLYNFFTSINKTILYTGISAIFTVLLMDLLLFNIPELFTNAHILGKLFYNISLSVIAASIFYIITVEYREYRERQHIYPYVKGKLAIILENGKQLFRVLAANSDVTISCIFPNENELKVICNKINPNAEAPMTLSLSDLSLRANWYQYFHHHCEHTLRTSTEITNNLLFLKPDLIELIREIEENSFINSAKFVMQANFSNQNLTQGHLRSFLKYIKTLKKIQNYVEKNLKNY